MEEMFLKVGTDGLLPKGAKKRKEREKEKLKGRDRKLTNRQKAKRVVVATMSEQPLQSTVDVRVAVVLKAVAMGPGQPHLLLTMAVVVVPSLLGQTFAELLEIDERMS